MNDVQFQEFLKQLGALFNTKESKEIEELKTRLEKLENERVDNLVLNKEIMMKLDSLTVNMQSINDYIKSQKEQPEKDRKDFIKQVIGTVISLSVGALFGYITNKK